MYYLERSVEVLENEGVISFIKRASLKMLGLSGKIPDQNRLYAKWIKNIEQPYLESEKRLVKSNLKKWKTLPKISILMPVYNVPEKVLFEAVESVKSQWYKDWELCLYDDCSTNEETKHALDELEKYIGKTSKAEVIKIKRGEKNLNISGATNEAFKISSGEYVMLMDNDDLLRPHALYEAVKVLNEGSHQKESTKHDQKFDLIYFDEDKLDKFGQRIEPFFKPDFSPELMWSMMYPTHAIFSRSIFNKAGKMRKGYEGSQDYDLVLRVMEITSEIYHIPKVLYSWRKIPGSTAEKIGSKSYAITSAQKGLTDALQRRGLNGKIDNDFYPFDVKLKAQKKSSIEIIIPTKDGYKLLKRCIDSINLHTHLDNVLITVIDHESKDKKTINYLSLLTHNSQIPTKVINYSGNFNFAKINNFAVSRSTADFLLFLNNDTEVITDNWIELLLGWAEQKNIACVSPRLLYPNKRVQHAGIILGAGGIANHAYYRMRKDTNFYFSNLHCVRNYSALTAACMLIGREKFLEVGGFNQELPASYNDVDLCLELTKKGYRHVYIPYLDVIHYESMSRNPDVKKWEDEYMAKKWNGAIDNDPYYNINLTRDLIKRPTFSL
jgi:O-antigen biosynthesis protein